MSATRAPTISVIVPARDAESTLPDTLAALADQNFAEPFEVVVVDDGSRDATEAIARDASVVDRVLNQRGGGPARARNAGAQASTAPSLAFLDADCRPVAGWLQAGRTALNTSDVVLGATSPRPDQPRGPFDRTLTVTGCSPLFESANLFVRRELFELLGGFESWLGPRAGKELGEDVWFGWRARRAGARISACPDALVHHAVFPRSAAAFAAELARLRFFPALAQRVPELRDELFYARVFLTERSARFDAAVAGLALAVIKRRLLPAVAALPYARTLASDLREPRTAAGLLAADAVGLVALALGSARYRSLLL